MNPNRQIESPCALARKTLICAVLKRMDTFITLCRQRIRETGSELSPYGRKGLSCAPPVCEAVLQVDTALKGKTTGLS